MGSDYKKDKFNILQFVTVNAIAIGATRYFHIGDQAAEARKQFRCPFTGVIRNLRSRAHLAPAGIETFTYMFRLAGANTLLTCVTTGAAFESQDLVNQIAVQVDDLINMRIACSVAAASAEHHCTVELVRV